MKIKRIKTLLVAFSLLLSTLSFNGFTSSGEPPQECPKETEENTYEPKIYSNVTIDQNYCGRTILVMLDRKVGGLNKIHKTSFFGDVGIERIVDLTFHPDDAEVPRHSRTDLDTTFRQMLSLKLTKDCKQNVIDVIRQLEKIDGIICAEPNYYVTFDSTINYPPTDPLYPTQWALPKIGVPSVWKAGITGNSDVRVGVIDDGISGYTQIHQPVPHWVPNDLHPNLDTNLRRRFVDGEEQTTYSPLGVGAGHGTRVAGIIGAAGDNGMGMTGVSWNVTLVSLRVAEQPWGGTAENIAAAITYAGNNNILILNMSKSTEYDISNLRQAIANYPGLFITSAGNNGSDNRSLEEKKEQLPTPEIYPQYYNLPNMITVGASRQDDTRFGTSDFSRHRVHLFAPGDGNTTTCSVSINCAGPYGNCGSSPTSPYCSISQTSGATPHVAGVAALLKSYRPTATTAELKWALLEGVDRIPMLENLCVTGGRLNAYKALRAIETINSPHIVAHIQSVESGRYLDSMTAQTSNNKALSLVDMQWNDAYAWWIIHRMDNAESYQIRSAFAGNGWTTVTGVSGVATIGMGQDLTVRRNADGTFQIRFGSGANASALTANGSSVVWQSFNSTLTTQRWRFIPHDFSYKRGDINRDGVVNAADITHINNHMNTSNPFTLSALQFYHADIDKNGVISNYDLDLAYRLFSGVASPIMTANNAPTQFTASASSNFGTYQPWMAFNHNLSNTNNSTDCWHSSLGSFNASTGLGLAWLQIDMGAPTRISSYRVYNRMSNANDNYAPRAFTLQGTNTPDVSNSWVILSTVPFRAQGTIRTMTAHSIAAPQTFRYYRLNITESHVGNNNGTVTVGQLELLY